MNSETNKQCTTTRFMRLLGFTGHKWKYTNGVLRTCRKCGKNQKLYDYNAFSTTWVDTTIC